VEGLRRVLLPLAVVTFAVAACAETAMAAGGWRSGPSLPQPRSEVAGALFQARIAVVGGFRADGSSSARVDVFDPDGGRWTRLTDLPLAVNHAMAAAGQGRLYVVGGYAAGTPQRLALAWNGRRWLRLPPLPEARAAAGAAFAAGRLYVVGGVGKGRRLARRAFVYEPASRRWSRIPGPAPREHLGVVALAGRVYAAGGRTAGFDTNLDAFQVYRPALRRWVSLPALPTARGGTGLAVVAGLVVSAGGEQPGGTIASVFAYDKKVRRWRPLPDLPTPRHGLALVGAGRRVYAIGGGPEPGLTVSGANESLAVGRHRVGRGQNAAAGGVGVKPVREGPRRCLACRPRAGSRRSRLAAHRSRRPEPRARAPAHPPR
jgi:N-acetylneuraminic acid mutarotase